MIKPKKIIKRQILPLLPLKGINVFPLMNLHFDVGRLKSIKALEEAMITNQMIFLVAQKDEKNNDPGEKGLYTVGTISRIKQLLKLPGDIVRVSAEGLSRAEISNFVQSSPFFMAEVSENIIEYDIEEDMEAEALIRSVHAAFEEYAKLKNNLSPDVILQIAMNNNLGELSDLIASNVFLNLEKKQELLSEFDPKIRLEKVFKLLMHEIDILELEKEINAKVRKQIDKMQKEYYLREQLKVIQKELGDNDGVAGEVDEYRERMGNRKLPKEVEEKVEKELNRLLKTPQGSAEGTVIRTYIDWILDLPWDKKTNEVIDLKRAEKILDEDHYGLEKVKQRILEYLAIRKFNPDLKGPILCLIGPPGVGKTSIAKSVARALNRNYVRMSLGGVRDEAEIRGHRRTYVGAMPGRIIAALKQAQSSNPLILMDEIDKMSSDFRGDPASALLEVLDSEQNFAFRDHYLELPFDLSDVMFMTTANNYDTIPRPLLDRMEVISLTSYTEEEKVSIGMRHLLPKQMKAHGLKKSMLKLDETVIRELVNNYTREAGVRNLEREIGKLCRRCVKEMLANNRKSMTVNLNNLEKIMGTKKYKYNRMNENDEIGIATGLAWTPVGGDTLCIEVTLLDGSGNLELTGQLGDVMKESAKAAISYIRSKALEFGIDKDFYRKYDIHIHIPEGAVPKDGPSAGITLATAMVSALTGCAVRRDVAMTGEITLRGRVLPIGGLKEKILAAHRAGIKTVIIPEENTKDIEDIPQNVKKRITFVPASRMETVLETALEKKIINFGTGSICRHEDKMIIPDPQPVISDVSSICSE